MGVAVGVGRRAASIESSTTVPATAAPPSPRSPLRSVLRLVPAASRRVSESKRLSSIEHSPNYRKNAGMRIRDAFCRSIRLDVTKSNDLVYKSPNLKHLV